MKFSRMTNPILIKFIFHEIVASRSSVEICPSIRQLVNHDFVFSDMNPDTARQLFENGGILLVLDCPKEMEFGIDHYSWQIGPQFHGIKMIPPGLHFCYYSERDLSTKQLANRQGFFIRIRQPDEMFVVVRWSPSDNLFQREYLTPDQYETRRSQRYELDRLLGQYPLDTYRQWLALSSHLQSEFLEKLLPLNGHICSSNVFDLNSTSQSNDFSVPKNLTEAESRLPKMTIQPEYALRLTELSHQDKTHSASDLTHSKLDRTEQLEQILAERFNSNAYGILCELEFSFVIFFLGQVYEGFEQWKRLINLLCSCQRAFCRWPLIYIEFLQIIYFQLKYFVEDEQLFVDIHQQDNYLYKSLENLFANLSAWNTEEKMDETNFDKLIQRADKMKQFLSETYQWTFEDEPDDEKPVVVE